MSVVYNPPEPHNCDLPATPGLRDGAIAQCTKCHRYSRLDAAMSLSGVRSWHRLDLFTVFGYMLIGRIPTEQTAPAKEDS